MNYIVLTGVKPYDGRYEFDPEASKFTIREWGWIKQHTGYMPLTIGDGLDGADPALFCAFAAVALHRADKIQAADVPGFVERLQDLAFEDTITLEADDEEGEPDSNPLADEKPTVSATTSGDGSPTSSENPGNGHNRSGTPASASTGSPQPW